MEYNDREWEAVKLDARKENISYNIKVIRELWKLRYNDYGREGKEYRDDVKSLYGTLDKSKETLRRLMTLLGTDKQSAIFSWAKKVENKTNIPGEYISGQEKIDITFCIEKEYCKYEEYLEWIIKLYDLVETLRNHEDEEMGNQTIDTIKFKRKKGKLPLREIKKFLEAFDKKTNDRFDELVEKAQGLLRKVEEYDRNMRDALKKLLVDNFEELLFHRDKKLYKLIFFIQRGRRYGTGNSIEEVVYILEDIDVKVLNELGKSTLSRYISALQWQLKIAEATYTLRFEFNKDINNKKKGK